MKMEQTECSETSAYKIQTPGNNPKESIQQGNIYFSFSIKEDITDGTYILLGRARDSVVD